MAVSTDRIDVEQVAAVEAGTDTGVGAGVDAASLTEVDLTAQLRTEDQAARVHRCCAVAVNRRRGLPCDESLPGEGRRGHIRDGVDGHPRERSTQMPAVVCIRGLRDVRNGQWVGRGHAGTEGKQNYENSASTKKSEHLRDPRGRC